MLFSGPADQRELRAAGRFNIVETRAVRFAHFARDVQAKARSRGSRREERLEQVRPMLGRDPRPIIEHRQSYSIHPLAPVEV